MPYFSIITPSFNRAHIIGKAIESVLAQTFTDFELIIVDDGSKDETESLILTRFSDIRIKYVFQSNSGVCSARNNGLKLARGKYICFLDSDDYVESDWLQQFFLVFNNNSSIDVVFCNGISKMWDGKERLINANYPYRPNSKDNKGIYLAGLFAINKKWFDIVGCFDQNLKFGEFTDFTFRINKFNPITEFTHKVGMYYIISKDGGGKNLNNKIDSTLYFLNKHKEIFLKSSHLHQIYLQIVAVAYFNLNDFVKGRHYLKKSWLKNIYNLKVLVRLMISYLSPVYKLIFK